MPPDTRALVDRVIDGGLDAYLLELREQGLSYDSIARRLESDHDVSVTGETVRTWVTKATESAASAGGDAA